MARLGLLLVLSLFLVSCKTTHHARPAQVAQNGALGVGPAPSGSPPSAGAPNCMPDLPTTHDLDGDGTRDSHVAVNTASGGSHVAVRSAVHGCFEVVFTTATVRRELSVVETIGFHFPGTLQAVAVYVTEQATGEPALFVLDLNRRQSVAAVPSAAGYKHHMTALGFEKFSHRPGLRFPYIAPRPAAYVLDTGWGFGCVLDLEAPSAGNCGSGFRAVQIFSLRNEDGSAYYPYAYDLDGNNVPESMVYTQWNQQRGATELVVNSLVHGYFTVWLSSTRLYPGQEVHPTGSGVGTMGFHFGGALQAVYAYTYSARPHPRLPNDYFYDPALFVVDLNRRQLVSWLLPPPGYSYYNTWMDVVTGPGNLRYPFLAPGQNAGFPESTNWNFLCIFNRAQVPGYAGFAGVDPACHTGFRRYNLFFTFGSTYVQSSAGRHHGGFLADTNFDGFTDITLPYLVGGLGSISGRDGSLIFGMQYDVAQTPDDSPLKWFHSGRQYGSFTPFTGKNGGPNFLLVGGHVVGSFSDAYCGVSSYAAMVGAPPGQPYRFQWSIFSSFLKPSFDQRFASLPLLRPADGTNGCIHRTAEAHMDTGTRNVAFYSRFTTGDAVFDPCVELHRDEIRSGFSGEAMMRWSRCAQQNYSAYRGYWTVQLLDADNGAGLTSWPNAYLWDAVEGVVPGKRVMLIETFDRLVHFDRRNYTPGRLHISVFRDDGSWEHLAQLPVNGVPIVTNRRVTGLAHGNSWGGYPKASLRDIDGDGLLDFQLNDGTANLTAPGPWYGYNVRTGAFERKYQ